MKFNSFLAATLLAAPALAAPKSGLADRVRGRSLGRASRPAERLAEEGVNIATGSDGANIEYSSNWAGAARKSPPSSGSYSAVSATFNVPEPTAVSEGSGQHGASAWVGIDGDTYQKAILQTGVDFTVQNGQKSYHAWYEWYPDYAHDFSLGVTAGDTVVAKVQSLSPSQGVAIIENQSNGQSATKTLSVPQPSATLEGKNAEWIVEDFSAGGTQVNLVDFGTVTFTGCAAEAGGSTYGVSNATIMEISQNGKVHADVKAESDSKLVVTYE